MFVSAKVAAWKAGPWLGNYLTSQWTAGAKGVALANKTSEAHRYVPILISAFALPVGLIACWMHYYIPEVGLPTHY